MNKLAKLRKERGLTQKNLATELDISKSNIAMYETGRRRPSLGRAKLIADFFEKSIDEIFL